MHKLRCYSYICLFCFCSFALQNTFAQDSNKIKIGAGSLLEGYYSIGLKLCRYISKANNNIPCEVIPTKGSRENLWLLQKGKIDFAFTLSNLALDSYAGKGYFAGSEPFTGMSQILKLHDEIFTVIVKDDDNILVFGDLDGKKISNGSPESDSTTIYKSVEDYYDFPKKPIDIEIAYEDYAHEFCKGNIDAIMLMTGHPSALVNFITHSCESDFVTIDNDKIEALLKESNAFHKVVLPAGGYPGITKEQNTIGVNTIFVTANHVDQKIVANFLKYFPKIVDHFKSSHPVLYDIDKNDFRRNFVLPGFKTEDINNKE
jgi:uncharacterized protein